MKTRVGAEEQYTPRTVGEILLNDILFSNEHPLGISYRHRKLFEDIFPHTEDTTLKLLMQTPGRPPVGSMLEGTLFHDAEDHFLFAEKVLERKVAKQRNPHIYRGECINVVKRGDSMLVPTFCSPRYTRSFTFSDFCRKAARELLMVAGL